MHANRDWAEVVHYMDEVQAQRDEQDSAVMQNQINFGRRIQERVSKAKQQFKEAREKNPAPNKSAILRNIRSNRKAETERMHQEEANQLLSTGKQNSASLTPEGDSHATRTRGRRSRGPQIPDIAELRKKRTGR
jgi:hypothetical protein